MKYIERRKRFQTALECNIIMMKVVQKLECTYENFSSVSSPNISIIRCSYITTIQHGRLLIHSELIYALLTYTPPCLHTAP